MCKSRLNSDYPYLQPDSYTHKHACIHVGDTHRQTKVCFPHTYTCVGSSRIQGLFIFYLSQCCAVFGAAEVYVTITSGFWTCVYVHVCGLKLTDPQLTGPQLRQNKSHRPPASRCIVSSSTSEQLSHHRTCNATQ